MWQVGRCSGPLRWLNLLRSSKRASKLRRFRLREPIRSIPLTASPTFSAWHHLVGRVRGRFDKVTGTITVSPDPAACSVDVTIDVSTISTQISKRDEDLRGDAYFDVKKFLTMTYQGRGIHRVSPDLWRMDGSLTMHGVTKVVPLTFKFNGTFSDTEPNEPARVAFHGTAGLKRAAFDMGARDNSSEVGDSTGPDVDIEIDVEADAASSTR
ncbi:YceI family protein [Tunturiibacter psychrotolerans]|uniref:YceI family protein n=1 Tax=Tunturiibacter psychrotolerans TaxID=3069686 RepID=UPI003D220203